MSESPSTLTIRGARGSTPTSGLAFVRHGGHTTCLETALAPNRRLILDAGSGLLSLHADLPADPGPEGFEFHVLFTHYHWDHLEGLPYFQPLYVARSRFTFYGFPWNATPFRDLLQVAMGPPYFPLGLEDTPSEKRYVELAGEPLEIGGVRITTARLRHPQGVTAYRLERDGRSVVFATDNERGDPAADAALAALARRADVLIHDAQYTPEEYEGHYMGWGHSSWRHAVEAARQAGVGRLLLTHHDPERTDAGVDEIVAAAKREFLAVEAAREGTVLTL